MVDANVLDALAKATAESLKVGETVEEEVIDPFDVDGDGDDESDEETEADEITGDMSAASLMKILTVSSALITTNLGVSTARVDAVMILLLRGAGKKVARPNVGLTFLHVCCPASQTTKAVFNTGLGKQMRTIPKPPKLFCGKGGCHTSLKVLAVMAHAAMLSFIANGGIPAGQMKVMHASLTKTFGPEGIGKMDITGLPETDKNQRAKKAAHAATVVTLGNYASHIPSYWNDYWKLMGARAETRVIDEGSGKITRYVKGE